MATVSSYTKVLTYFGNPIAVPAFATAIYYVSPVLGSATVLRRGAVPSLNAGGQWQEHLIRANGTVVLIATQLGAAGGYGADQAFTLAPGEGYRFLSADNNAKDGTWDVVITESGSTI